MKITELVGKSINLGFIGQGVSLPANGSVTVEDRYGSHPSLQNLVSLGKVSISDFSAGDSSVGSSFDKNRIDSLSIFEFNNFVKGMFVVSDTWSDTGTIAASATAASLLGSAVGPFDLSVKNILEVTFDGLTTVKVTLPSGQVPVASVVTALNANTEFAKWGVASEDTSKLKIASKAIGENSNVVIVKTDPRSAHVETKMDAAVLTAGTNTVGTVTAFILTPSGEGMRDVQVVFKIYTEDISSGNTLSAQLRAQRLQKGTYVSGAGTNTLTVKSGPGGEVKFEVAAIGAISETDTFIGVDIPATYKLATHPANRLQIRP